MSRQLSAVFLALVLILMSAGQLHAKASFYPFPDLVSRSDVVALVDVTASNKVPFSTVIGAHWKYAQKNVIRFVRVYKKSPIVQGRLNRSATLWAEKGFICARASYKPGRYLVFLRQVSSGVFVTLNHDQGALRADSADNLDFSWYFPSKKRVPFGQVASLVSNAIADSRVATFKAKLYAASKWLNLWRPGWSHQALWFSALRQPTAWPIKASYMIPGMLSRKVADRSRFQALTTRATTVTISGHWSGGSFVIDSIRR